MCLSKEYIWRLLENNRTTTGSIYRFLMSSTDEKAFYKKDYLYILEKSNEAGLQQVYDVFERMKRELLDKEPGYLYIFHGLVERLFGVLQNQDMVSDKAYKT